MTDTESRIDPADEREFEEALKSNGTASNEGTTEAESQDPYPVTDVPDFPNRFLAALIDGVIAGVVGLVPFIGGLAGTAYLVCRDGLDLDFADRRSIGKRVMQLRPVRLDGQPMDIPTSIKRNWMFGLGAIVQLLLFIPILGWLLILPVGLVAMVLGVMELYKTLTDSEQRRFGDHWAGTRVVIERLRSDGT